MGGSSARYVRCCANAPLRSKSNVVSDLIGKTGLALLRRIVAGERDPEILAILRDRRLRAREQTVARSRHGN